VAESLSQQKPEAQSAGTSSLLALAICCLQSAACDLMALRFGTEPFLGFRTEPFAFWFFLLLEFHLFPAPADQLTGAGMPALECVMSAIDVVFGDDHGFITDQGAFTEVNALERIDRWPFIDVLARGNDGTAFHGCRSSSFSLDFCVCFIASFPRMEVTGPGPKLSWEKMSPLLNNATFMCSNLQVLFSHRQIKSVLGPGL
jgi:hypothetical protein